MQYLKYIFGTLITIFSLFLGNVVSAANVVVFNNPLFVEATETANLIAALTAQGHTVTTFTGTTALDIANATAGQNTLVISEFAGGSTVFTNDPLARAALFNFTNTGGSQLVKLNLWFLPGTWNS